MRTPLDMLILRCVLDSQVKMRLYLICKLGTQTGHIVENFSILLVRKGTSYDGQWNGHRPEKEEDLGGQEEGEELAEESEKG